MCTTIFLKNEMGRFVARNMDIFLGLGRIFTNRRHVEKTAFVLPPEPALRWVSKYGNVTFCQVGKESPSGGLNEKGLSVEQMTLPETQYPAPDARPAVKELQWIQYMLDTCATVDEVMEKAQDIRVVASPSVLHYLVCDREGHAAIFEYLNGELAFYSGDDLPVEALANSPYADSLYALRGKQPLPDDASRSHRGHRHGRRRRLPQPVPALHLRGEPRPHLRLLPPPDHRAGLRLGPVHR
jgi:penicillin V acylase-like amidase (Ntn superfamily)